MAKKKTKSNKSSSKATSDGGGAPVPTGSAKQYEKFLPAAMKIPRREVEPLRGDVELALVNARRGVEAVLAKKKTVAADLPHLSVDQIASLPDLGLGLAYAAGQVARYAPPSAQIRQMLQRAHRLRSLLLQSADALALAGLLPANAVRQIHHGHGGVDVAGDCIALAALYRKNAAQVRGKSPVTSADIAEAATLGSQLLGVLKPESASRSRTTAELRQARNVRDRLWTLFTQRWQNLWRAGAWLFGPSVDHYVPPLHSHAGRRAKRAPVPATRTATSNGRPGASP